MTIKAIEVEYDGHKFRSRLEARWAVFFNALGVDYEYEPEGFELPSGKKYLPDFRVKCYGTRGYAGYKKDFCSSDLCASCKYGNGDSWAFQQDCTNKALKYDEHGFIDGVETDCGTCYQCPGYEYDDSTPFDLYIEVKGKMTKYDADRIREFANISYEENDFGRSADTNPILIVGDIPNVKYSEDYYQSSIFNCYEDMGFGVLPFNYQLIDGDVFGAYPAVTKDGRFYLFGDDSNYVNSNCSERLTNAYQSARRARFEHGETPVIRHD